jgi:hypothetical protein
MKLPPSYIWNYGDEFLVVCPSCAKCALVRPGPSMKKPEARLTCPSCGYAKDWVRKQLPMTNGKNPAQFEEGVICIGAPVDWFFHQPLWLQAPCCGETLWAYNAKYLKWLRAFVSADLRERSKSPTLGWSNKSLASRLPKWIKQASNRKAVLAAITRMENRLLS